MSVLFIFAFLWLRVLGLLSFTFETHGFNDIDALFQQIRKGARFCKLDVAPAEADQCLRYSSTKAISITEELYDERMGCLALRGDFSAVPYFNNHFNTSEDLLQFLASESMAEVYSEFAEDEFLVIFLDFQFFDKYDENRLLLIDFLLKLIDFLGKQNKVRVNLNNCFPLKYKKYCEENPSNCETMRPQLDRIINFQDFFCEDREHPLATHRVFNNEFVWLPNFCRFGARAFEKSLLPYFFWELNKRKNIVKFFDQTKDCGPLKGRKFIVTTNIDIDLFSKVYYYYNPADKGGLVYELIDLPFEEGFLFLGQVIAREKNRALNVFRQKSGALAVQLLSLQEDSFLKILQTMALDSTTEQFVCLGFSGEHLSLFCEEKVFVFHLLPASLSLVAIFPLTALKPVNGKFASIRFDSSSKVLHAIWLTRHLKLGLVFAEVAISETKVEIVQSFQVASFSDAHDFQIGPLKLDPENKLLYFSVIFSNEEGSIVSLFYRLNIAAKSLSPPRKFLGEAISLDVDSLAGRFVLILTSSPIYYGNASANNNESCMCSAFMDFDRKVIRRNRKHLTSYFYGQIDFFDSKEDPEFASICDRKMLQGTIGLSLNVSAGFYPKGGESRVLVAEQLASAEDADTYSVLFGGIYEALDEKNKLAVFKISVSGLKYK